jgi:acyl carrier protein
MNSEDIFSTLQDIFRDVLDNQDLVIFEDMTADDVDNWDSLAHISIITSIEKSLQIRFAISEIESLQTVGDMVKLVENKSNE